MMPIDWNAAISVMRDALPPNQFKNWVEPLSLLRCEENRVILGAPNKFHEDWVRENYSVQLSSALESTCGRQLCLEFEVSQQNQESALGEGAMPEIVIAPPSRPLLRVVEPSAEPRKAIPPNIPPSKHPYYPLESNRMAYQCAMHMIETEAQDFNLLIIEAGIGMGKTHLMSHIAEGLYARDPMLRIHYTNTEAFTSEMYQSYQNQGHREFRKKYWQDIDVLLFDDLHMIPKKQRAQEELYHAFNEIISHGGRIVFGTSLNVRKLEEVMPSLKSRLESAVSAEIRFPSFDDRTRLLAQIALHQQLALDDLTLRSMADRGQKDIRDLISTLMRVHLQAQLANRALDTHYLAEIGFAIDTKKEAITLDEIVGLVEHTFGVGRDDLLSKSRMSSVNWARQVAMYLARVFTHLSMESIGNYFGRDHATVVHAYQRVADGMEQQPTKRYEVAHLKQKLQSRAPKNHVPF
ncbi:MAG: ATP-binding protein [Deltaproteobacteria bacterium]|nr:ATP-binding protein [Deltaproteobacteria bacterium]MBI3295655.1 ATP-binding protein [Deltaproteobacteria bacterium]